MKETKPNPIKDKSFRFAVRIVRLYKQLTEQKKEYILSKQILRSGTSVGANIREGQNAVSKADFIHKLSISQKEADETLFWLELLHETGFIDEKEFQSYHKDCEEILKILRTIILNTKRNK